MRKREREKILKEYRAMSDQELLKEFSDKMYASLGSTADIMAERCYDSIDIKEQRDYEKYLSECSGLAESVLSERGIDPFKEISR